VTYIASLPASISLRVLWHPFGLPIATSRPTPFHPAPLPVPCHSVLGEIGRTRAQRAFRVPRRQNEPVGRRSSPVRLRPLGFGIEVCIEITAAIPTNDPSCIAELKMALTVPATDECVEAKIAILTKGDQGLVNGPRIGINLLRVAEHDCAIGYQ